MSLFRPNAKILELPDLGPVCCLLNYDNESEEWKVEIHFYHPDIAPSHVAFGYSEEDAAVELMEGMTPDLAKRIITENLSGLLGWDLP